MTVAIWGVVVLAILPVPSGRTASPPGSRHARGTRKVKKSGGKASLAAGQGPTVSNSSSSRGAARAGTSGPSGTSAAGKQQPRGVSGSTGAAPSQGTASGGNSAAAQGGGSGQGASGQAGEGEDPEAAKWKPVVGSRILTRAEIHVGDPVEIRVTVVHDPKVSVNLPAVLDFGDGVEVLGQGQKSTETLDDGKVREEFWVKVVCFHVGDIVPKDVEVTYTYPGPGGGAMATIRTNPGTIKVSSVMANEANPKLKPDEGPVPVMEENRTAKYVLVALAALLLGALAGWLGYLLYRRRHRVGPPPPPPRPAHEIAFEKLNAISESGLLDEGRFKEFYFAVSEAVREYLGNRFGFDSLEMTTTELLDQIKRVELIGITWDQVAEFSSDCDLVKFTKYQPEREEAETILRRAYELVRASMLAAPKPGEEQSPTDVSPQESKVVEEDDDETRWAPKPASGAGRSAGGSAQRDSETSREGAEETSADESGDRSGREDES